MNLLWYHNKKDKGIVFEKFFSPFPVAALALVYTAAECCIDEWSDSKQMDISFLSNEYKEAYDKHIANLKNILKELNDNGRLHAKVDPLPVGDAECISDDEINNAIQEYQQGSGANGSDDEDTELESEGGEFKVEGK
ncbi:uncharacterized protein BJ212DRAFT_1294640 [Suillus subaureus]|uniref:DUF6532 domain-containing protein n=1 Tax=Suillus subaureus TaxID=48587 RepID=A0A9P7EP29_9AGAM|nr:uncharacterized protein BJ212DRAFT_1294640 [Suillus subaureus]KAG1827340.1 hypothetical protein BJ212DRAFT_1294640 [Suillus subaureus]